MPTKYKAPLKDMMFVLYDVLGYQRHVEKMKLAEEAPRDIVEAIAVECAKFAEEVLAPLNSVGDEHGCKFENGVVTTPPGFKEAYQQYCAGGWQGLSHPPEYGGQGLPLSLSVLKSEMVATANWSWGMYPGLSFGAMNTLFVWGTEDQRKQWLPKLCEGTWTGTMCLTEAHCGSDLGQMKSRAVPNDDGSYSVTGTKIFISCGEHDMADNIIHIVLARTPNSPDGTKGISLFIIPKFLVNADGSLGERNAVNCGSIEHKMGIHGSSTCVINLDGAKGWLLGPEHKGMAAMFTFMNSARIGTALQGLAAAELSYQNALPYAIDRHSMRALSGKKTPDKPADPIICHADVRRMLLTQKAFSEGARAMCYHAAMTADYMIYGETEDAKKAADDTLGFLTPILKAFLTEIGYDCANIGMQVFGGHGYISEHGMEQIVRDTRISSLYEGTTGIQALDLLGRKIILAKFKGLFEFTGEVLKFCRSAVLSKGARNFQMAKMIATLTHYALRWNWLTFRIMAKAARNRDAVSAASFDFIMYSGYTSMAYFWARMALVAHEQLAQGTGDAEFLKAKLETAQFYFERMLPRAKGHAATMMASTDSVMQMPIERFIVS